LASLMAALGLWEHLGRPGALEPWLTGYHARMWREDFSPSQRTVVLHAYAGNYGVARERQDAETRRWGDAER